MLNVTPIGQNNPSTLERLQVRKLDVWQIVERDNA
jgi:hypothetical protein